MQASFRALVADILDFAGLFPPAELALDEAIRNYATYRERPEAWMLARFICPASRLSELTPYVNELFNPGSTLRLSVLGRGGPTDEQFLDATNRDLDDIAAFCDQSGDAAAIEVVETRLSNVTSTKDDASRLLRGAAEARNAHGMAHLPVFYEPPLMTEWESVWPAIIQGLAQHESDGPAAGFKLRCGGLDPSAYPSIEQVASVLTWARDSGVPLKFTAGLHHPLRHYNESAGATMHGFLNIFAAGILSACKQADQKRICGVLEASSGGAFDFASDRMSIDGTHITTDEIEQARGCVVTSFGSCSFDEPLEDLRKLSLL